MRVLITGGAGFIGSHLVDALCARGDDVRVLDDLSTGSRANLEAHSDQPRFSFIEGSVTDSAIVREAAAGCDVIFHLAAAIGVRHVVDDPVGGIATNVRGTEEVLRAAPASARVVVASSSEVYGKGKAGAAWAPFREDDDSVLGPTSITRWWYALAKGLDEHLAFAFHRQHGLAVSAVRYFNIFGPRCDPRGYGVLARFIPQALRGDPLTIFGDGEQTRSFTYVEDAVRATMLAAESQQAIGQVFNVGSPDEVSINAVASAVILLTGSPSTVHHQGHETVFGSHFEDTRRRVPDVRKAQSMLGFSTRIDLYEGIRRTAQWWSDPGRLA